MKTEPRHREVFREILAEIVAGKYGVTGRLPSEAQLVQRFGVSRPTIGRALRDLGTEGLIERRAGSGSYVLPQKYSASTTRQLGLLIPSLAQVEIFGVICGELARLARAQEYTLLWGDSAHSTSGPDLNPEHAVALCEHFIERRVSGVFFAPFDFDAAEAGTNRRIVERFNKAGIPVVLLDRDVLPFPHRSPLDLVGIDNLAAGCLLAEHLLKLGASRLAFVAQPQYPSTVAARIAGVRETLLQHHQELIPDWVQLGDAQDLKFVRTLTGGRRWDGVVCANDLTAAQLIRTLEKINLRVPEDLPVVGFDDAEFATLLNVPLTTVHQPCQDIATTAYRAMMERISEPTLPMRSLLLAPRLVVRESCGAYLPRVTAPKTNAASGLGKPA